MKALSFFKQHSHGNFLAFNQKTDLKTRHTEKAFTTPNIAGGKKFLSIDGFEDAVG